MTIEDLQAVLMNMSQTELSELAEYLHPIFKDPRGADIRICMDDGGWTECKHCERMTDHATDCDYNNARLMLGWED